MSISTVFHTADNARVQSARRSLGRTSAIAQQGLPQSQYPLQRKAACACGGGCPACQAKSNDLKISQPNDPAEIEADQMADRVMQMTVSNTIPEGSSQRPSGTIYRKCDACEEEEDGASETIQRKESFTSATPTPPPDNTPPLIRSVINPGGQPLDSQIRSFFEPRFGADFSHVRIHTDSAAGQSARAIDARAYSLGNNIIFGSGEYRPESETGQHLLAHELAHTIQQSGRNTIQRRLLVDGSHPSAPPVSAPATDPAASLTQAQRFTMMGSIISSLCPDFLVDSGSGEVGPNVSPPPSRNMLASGSTPVGCCCLAVLTDALNTWTIEVSQVLGPHTLPASRQVVLSPTSTPIEFGSFTLAGNLAFQGQVPAAGHELCGHAALIELNAHPTGDRLRTDVHDPTVRMENLISTEQGVLAADLRGLASDSHRGESVDRIVVSEYPLNGSDPAGLSLVERDKLKFAANYAVANDSWVDIIGHSDHRGSTSAKNNVSQKRAEKAKDEMVNNLGVPDTITKHEFTGASRFTRVAGVGDTQPLPGSPPATSLRRVEILMAGFPAGAQVPPAGTPTTVTSTAIPVAAQQTPADPCEATLIGGAFPP